MAYHGGNYKRGEDRGRLFVMHAFNDYYVRKQGSFDEYRARVEGEAKRARADVLRAHDPAAMALAKGYADGLMDYRDPMYNVRREGD